MHVTLRTAPRKEAKDAGHDAWVPPLYTEPKSTKTRLISLTNTEGKKNVLGKVEE